MRVTGIAPTKKGRSALMVDGEFAYSLHRDTFLLCPWLQKGAEVSPERLETLRQEDELRSARERAVDLLSAAEQTSGTLRQKLLRWYGEEAEEAAVLRMEELGLINDLDYGRRNAADAVNLRGWPRRRIAMELQKKGVPAEVIEEALADITEETEIETACRLLEGPYRGRLRARRERDKVKAALQRRGFSFEVIRQAVSRTLETLPEGGETPEPEETHPPMADVGLEQPVLLPEQKEEQDWDWEMPPQEAQRGENLIPPAVWAESEPMPAPAPMARTCPQCGVTLETDQVFCHNCGCQVAQGDRR